MCGSNAAAGAEIAGAGIAGAGFTPPPPSAGEIERLRNLQMSGDPSFQAEADAFNAKRNAEAQALYQQQQQQQMSQQLQFDNRFTTGAEVFPPPPPPPQIGDARAKQDYFDKDGNLVTETALIGGRQVNTPGETGEKTGILDLARGLATEGVTLPDQEVAGFTADQQRAFDTARAGVGSFQPYLSAGTALTRAGVSTLDQARAQTLGLGAQIPGQISSGQGALSRAAQDLQTFSQQGGQSADQAAQRIVEASQSSDPATRNAAEELMGSSSRLGQLAGQTRANLSGVTSAADARFSDATSAAQGAAQAGQAGLAQAAQGALGVAGDAASRARALQSPLEGDLARATSGASGAARTGQANLQEAADRARASTAAAQQGLMASGAFGLRTAQQGIGALRGTTGAFDPASTAAFMSQFDDAAVNQALRDIGRQGNLAQQDVRARAVQSGAFGGSRQAVAEQELQRNVLEQQGRTAAQMRAAGFESAAQRAQQAFEAQQGRAQQAASLTGQLGQGGAGSAMQAAAQAGQLGLGAEQLAQGSAGQGAQLGMSAEQFRAANAQSLAQTGLSVEQLAAQTGLSAQQIAGEFAAQGAQLGLAAADQASRNAAQMAQLGMSAEQIAAQTGLSVEQARQAAAGTAAGLSQSQAQIGMQGAQSAGSMGMQGADMRMQGAQAAGNLGLQGSQLGLSGIQAGLGAQQQAAGIGQGIAGLGQQMVGLGQAQQQFTSNDVNSMLGIGGMQQQLTQAEMDAQRANQFQQAMQPYQQLAFLSDITSGAPSGQMSTMTQPGPSVGSQLLGLGTFAGATYLGSRDANRT
jgi:hypothetical protein